MERDGFVIVMIIPSFQAKENAYWNVMMATKWKLVSSRVAIVAIVEKGSSSPIKNELYSVFQRDFHRCKNGEWFQPHRVVLRCVRDCKYQSGLSTSVFRHRNYHI